MPRAVWRGAISFGLVTVPVRIYPAVRRKAVRFHELDRVTGRRVRHQRVREEPAEESGPVGGAALLAESMHLIFHAT